MKTSDLINRLLDSLVNSGDLPVKDVVGLSYYCPTENGDLEAVFIDKNDDIEETEILKENNND